MKAASVGSSIYNLFSRSPAHSECSQSPVISDRFASPPLIYPTTPYIHPPTYTPYTPSICPTTPHLSCYPLHLPSNPSSLYLPNNPFTYPPNSLSPPTSPGDVGMLVTHRSLAAPSHHQGLSCCSPTEHFHRSHRCRCCLHFQQLPSTHPAFG